MKKFRISTLFMAALMMLAVSCAEDGETGPVGPVGPEGPPGPPGKDGTGSGGGGGGSGGSGVEVKAYTFTVNQSDYSVFSGPDTIFFMHRYKMTVPEIDSDVMNNGTVQVFTKGTSENDWKGMPYYRNRFAYNFTVGLGEVEVEISYRNGAKSPVAVGDADYKVVVIPSSSIKAGLDDADYEMLQEVYGFQ